MDSVEIKNLRKELGMTLVEFSELLGVTKRTVINYEQGKVIPASKNKLLQFIRDTKNAKKETPKVLDVKNNLDDENTNKDSLSIEVYLKNHISTLKELILEKTNLLEIYKAENIRLKEELEPYKSK